MPLSTIIQLYHGSQGTMLYYYTTLVRPIIEYACIIWEPVTQKNIRELEMVQRRAARFVTGDYSSVHQ